MNFSQPETWLAGIALTILGFIGRQMISKLDALSRRETDSEKFLTNKISDVDKSLAVIIVKIDNYENTIKYQGKQIEENSSRILENREKMHEIRNLINQLQIRDLN